MEAERSPSTPVPRRRRIPAAEVRERMLRAAQDIVLETGGVTISLEEMSLEDVMRRAQVSRSSVYRLWPYKGDFVDDLLCRLAEPEWIGTAQAFIQRRALDVAWDVVNTNKSMLTTFEGRRAAMREVARRAVLVAFKEMNADPAWPVYFALSSTLGGVRDPHARAKIASALENFEKDRADNIARFFRELTEAIGWRLRKGYRFEHLAVTTGAMLQGMLLRTLIARHVVSSHRPGISGDWSLDEIINGTLMGPGLDSETVDWSPAAVTYLGIIETFLEVNPDVDVPAN